MGSFHVVDMPARVEAAPSEARSPSLRVAVEQAAGQFTGLEKSTFGGSIALSGRYRNSEAGGPTVVYSGPSIAISPTG